MINHQDTDIKKMKLVLHLTGSFESWQDDDLRDFGLQENIRSVTDTGKFWRRYTPFSH